MGVEGAGSTLAYTETLHNLTGATDSFSLTLSGNVWTTTLSITNTGSISYQASVDFTVWVDIPGGATVGSSDLATVTVTSVLSPSVYSDTAAISTTVMCSPTVVFSGQSAQTEGDLNDTYYYSNQKFVYVYVNGYSDDNDTLNATVSGYDPVGAAWQTIAQQVNGTGGVIADQYFVPVTYNRVRVQLDDTEDNDLIYYNYQFIVCGLPLRWVPAVFREYP